MSPLPPTDGALTVASAGRGGVSVRPTVFGMALAVVVVVTMVVTPAVADPSLAGLVWGGLLGVLVLGVLWPVVTVRLVVCEVVAAPTDLVVGQLSSVQVRLSGRAAGLSLSCSGSGATVVDAASPGTVRLPFAVSRRGAYRQVLVEVGSDAPFGVVVARRRRVLDLPRDLLVAPGELATAAHTGIVVGDTHELSSTARPTQGESVRSVRPYVTGDPAHLVHWPTTARTGSLVVRELEPLGITGVAVVVDLTGTQDPVLADAAAARAGGAVQDALQRGARVLVCTSGPSGPRCDAVADLLAARRILAVADSGVPPEPPEGWKVQRITPSPVPSGSPAVSSSQESA